MSAPAPGAARLLDMALVVFGRRYQRQLRFIADTMSLRWTMPTDELAHIVTSSLDGLTLSWLTDHDSDAARRHIAVLATTFAAMAAPADDAGRTGSEGRQR